MTRRDLLRTAGLVALAAACRGEQAGARRRDAVPTTSSGRLAYTGGQVYRDGTFAEATVVVEDDRIAAVTTTEPADAAPFDAQGLWLIPGFIDAHVHLQFAPAESILANGVTTVRDLGSPPGVADGARRATRLRVLAAGRILTPINGYPSQSWGADGTSREVRDADDAGRAVVEQADAGAGVIKIALEPAGGPLFRPAVLRAIVDAAHEKQLGVTAHVGSAQALAMAVEHGVDELAHLPLYDVTAGEMADVAAAGLVLVPTLAIRSREARALRAVEAFLAAGGTVVYGTDLGNTGTAPGIEQPELRALLDVGMPAASVLDAATSVAADHLGLTRSGRIEVGAAADLVGLAADPFADVAAYDDVTLVVASGSRVVG